MLYTEPSTHPLRELAREIIEKNRQQRAEAAASRARLIARVKAPLEALRSLLTRERKAKIDCGRFRLGSARRRATAMRRR